MQCIMIDHPKHLYLMDNYTPTHNSWAILIKALWKSCTRDNNQVLIICPGESQVVTLFRLLNNFISASPLVKELVKSSKASPFHLIEFTNGSTISGFTTGARAKKGADSIRGQSADDVIVDEAAYLDDTTEGEGDWKAINAIITGDATREVSCMVSSTPKAFRGTYYRICTMDQSNVPEVERWDRIHVAVVDNPEYPQEKIDAARATETETNFLLEWMADFPDIGDGVFKNSYIDRAQRSYYYYSKEEVNAFGFSVPPAVRTMGVDWDKYQAGPSIVILELDKEQGVYKLCYVEEVEKAKYVLSSTVQRIIQLDRIFNCKHIYVDRGFGEQQIELLHMHGESHPGSDLDKKVQGFTFSDKIEVMDPIDGLVKKPIKPFMVNILVKWLEENKFIFSQHDKSLTRQMQGYRVTGISVNSITYSDVDEHLIDAVCLACYAMFKNYADPFKINLTQEYLVLNTKEFLEEKEVPLGALNVHAGRNYDLDTTTGKLPNKREFHRTFVPSVGKRATF